MRSLFHHDRQKVKSVRLFSFAVALWIFAMFAHPFMQMDVSGNIASGHVGHVSQSDKSETDTKQQTMIQTCAAVCTVRTTEDTDLALTLVLDADAKRGLPHEVDIMMSFGPTTLERPPQTI
jgi:hypothetical protein